MEIKRCHLSDFVRGMDEKKGSLLDRRLQQDEAECDCHAYAHRTQQQVDYLRQIPLAECLRGHSAGTHPQKAEYPVDDIEQHATHGNSAYVGGRTQMADDGYINQAEQRHGDVRYDGR